MKSEELDNVFTYHKPDPAQSVKYDELRGGARAFARMVNELCPESREKSLAITNIQQSVMWANAAIALHDNQES